MEETYTLEQWRKLKGFSQEKLARESGVSTRTIYLYEKDLNNLRNASYNNIQSIADALGIRLGDIFLGDTSVIPN